jgi:hypothetical protein
MFKQNELHRKIVFRMMTSHHKASKFSEDIREKCSEENISTREGSETK